MRATTWLHSACKLLRAGRQGAHLARAALTPPAGGATAHLRRVRRLLQCVSTPAVTVYAPSRAPLFTRDGSATAAFQLVVAFESAFNLTNDCGTTYSCLLSARSPATIAAGSARQLDTTGTLFLVRLVQ